MSEKDALEILEKTQGDTTDEKLDTLIRLEKRQTAFTAVRLVLAAVLTAVLTFFALQITSEVRYVSDAVTDVKGLIAVVEKDLDDIDFKEINTTVKSLQDAAGSLDKSLNQLDFETLNQTIEELQGAASTLSDIDTDTLNELVSSLENVSKSLSDSVDSMKNLFSGGLFGKKN